MYLSIKILFLELSVATFKSFVVTRDECSQVGQSYFRPFLGKYFFLSFFIKGRSKQAANMTEVIELIGLA